ncbi:hypothetical protein [Solirubrobacter ginsenosidimutans]|uniref:hypothetical protein n=1 Tax=Solirubrobacter ginsenosidimutans TaxID=490573 RepID=UPI0022CE2834|nr:hypothetical protein [Solirubrobacter ginsenosidimutans]
MTPDDYLGQAVFRVRDYGAEHEHFRFEVDLAFDGPSVLGWGTSPWEALRDLLGTHPGQFEAALASQDRDVDAWVLLGDWHMLPEDELVGLTCMVLRDERRVPVDHQRPYIYMPEDAPEVHELARWLLHRWRDARELES